MRWSRLFIPTLREVPAHSSVHPLLIRAGYVREIAPAATAFLPLGERCLVRLREIVRREFDRVAGQEIALTCAADEQLAAVAALIRTGLRSYRQLPQLWFEADGGTGVRCWAIHLEKMAAVLAEAISGVIQQCGLEPIKAEAPFGRRWFAVPSDRGELSIVICPGCGYSADAEIAVSQPVPPTIEDPEGDLTPERFYTPGLKTISDVARFVALPETSQMKSLVVASREPLLVLLRGDHQLSMAKAASALGTADIQAADAGQIPKWFGAGAGSLGPVGISGIRILADTALQGRRNMICGANEDDYHLKNVTPEEDFAAEWFDLRHAAAGDTCRQCGRTLQWLTGTALASIKPQHGASELFASLESGAEQATEIWSADLYLDRLLSATAGRFADGDGLVWQPWLAPFSVVITPVNYSDAMQREAADLLHADAERSGPSALLDDRDERPGVKFKDADLIGMPYRITVGKKITSGLVEVVQRGSRVVEELLLHSAIDHVRKRIGEI